MATHTLKVALVPGSGVGEFDTDLAGVNVSRVVKVFNGFGELHFTFPKHDPPAAVGQGALMVVDETRVQFWRDGDTNPMFWGILVSADADTDSAAVVCVAACIGWPLLNRVIGTARENHHLNPSFEDDDDDWTSTSLVATPATDVRIIGEKALRLVGAGGTLTQSFDITATAVGTNVYVAIGYIVEAMDDPDSSGQEILRLDSPAGDIVTATAYIDPTRIGEIQEAVVMVPVPASTTWTLTTTITSPGTVVVDDTQAVIPESVSDYDQDIAVLMGMPISHAQDTAIFDASADLGISIDTPATGITLPVKAWQYAEYIPVMSAVGELQNRSDGPDWAIIYEAGGPVFRTFHPFKGTDRTGTVTLAVGVNAARIALSDNGATARKEAIYYGGEEGPHRHEGRAIDTSRPNMPLMQSADSAPTGTNLDDLQPLAAGKTSVTAATERALTVTSHQGAGDLVGVLEPGDLVLVDVDDGWLAVPAEARRIVTWEYQPPTETLVLTLAEPS